LSYEIIYGKQFVKLRRTGEVIPMLLAGSNNCFEVGTYLHRNGRRTRDWSNDRYYNRKGKISEKPDVILKNLDAELRRRIRNRYDKEGKPADIRNHFGYYASIAVGGGHCGDTSWNLYRSQYANGIKNALTVEELAKLGVTLYFHDVSIHEIPNGKPDQVDITSEPQYFVELKKWRAWQAESGKGFWVSFHPLNTDRVLVRLRAPKRKAPREKTRIEQDHFFVLTDGYSSLMKYIRSGYRYSYHKDSGKRFRTEKGAEKYRQQLLKNGRYKADIWKVERIDLPATFLV